MVRKVDQKLTVTKDAINRTGSLRVPYLRGDGIATVRLTLTVPTDFMEEWKRFKAELPLGTNPNDWVTKELRVAMRQYRKEKRA